MDNQLEMVNSIVKSTNELLPLLRRNAPLNNTIYNTISDILKFLDKVLVVLPDILISERNDRKIKTNLQESFERVISGWGDFFVDSTEFFAAWDEFSGWWSEFERALEILTADNSTIFLSMN